MGEMGEGDQKVKKKFFFNFQLFGYLMAAGSVRSELRELSSVRVEGKRRVDLKFFSGLRFFNNE